MTSSFMDIYHAGVSAQTEDQHQSARQCEDAFAISPLFVYHFSYMYFVIHIQNLD